MRETSSVWKQLIAAKHTSVEYKFLINGIEYTLAQEESHKVHHALFEDFGIGNATIGELELTIYADSVPRAARIERMMRLVGIDGKTTSDWQPAGVFFASRRAMDDGKWTIEAYDAMRKASVVWEPDQELEFPMTMPDAVAEFCRILEVELDPRTELNAAYTIDYPTNDYTIRNCLCFIAAAHGGNWIINPGGKLHLVPLRLTGESHSVGLDLMRFEDNGARRAVTRVTLYVDSEQVLTAGNDDGLELTADCPYATQEMVDALLATLGGLVYHPYEAGAARLDPAAELGDIVEVGDITSMIVSMTDDGSGYPDISAPGSQELADEYPDAGPMSQQINRKIATVRSAIEKTINGIKLSVTDSEMDGYVSLSLIVGGVTQSLGLIDIRGNVNITGDMVAAALYAALGDIAELTVDSLSTKRTIPKYLAGDKDDINYIDIRDRKLALIRAWTDGSTEQAVNAKGQLLYWETDISDAEIKEDGYPYIEDIRVFAVTYETDYPVMVYKYNEGIRWLQSFDAGNNYGPIQYWGEGYGDPVDLDRGKGVIQKLGKSLDFLFKTSIGAYNGMVVGDDYTDIFGQRKTAMLDFSNFDNGSFTEHLDGIVEGIVRTVDFDDSEDHKPILITDEVGHQTQIVWPDESEAEA